jgi:hypothetical protein
MNAFVLAGLVKRRAEIAGDIEKAHESLRRIIVDLENLDATIQQFDPRYESTNGGARRNPFRQLHFQGWRR